MKTILNIANITFWEIIRDKILYGLIFVALILLLVSSVMAQLSFAEQAKITMDFSLFVLNISTVVISIFLGSQMLYREVESKTLLTLLTHPVTRFQFVLGKILGLFYIVLVLTVLFMTILFLQAWHYEYKQPLLLILPMLGILLEAIIILSLTICLSSFLRVSISIVIALFVYLMGHSIENIKFFAEKSEDKFLQVIYDISNVIIPNFELMNWKSVVTTQTQIGFGAIFQVLIYSLVWFLIFNIISLLIFSRRDLS